ncbi:hypothetical protein [Streptomyces albus]|uniref:hypothetical protein n=1 Tax=Streptomyces sp. PHES57 TaxID=2872626 RepID=UPI001CEDA2CF|nr:hypothetical protein [Streptomyces sp. PHES57]
MADGRELDAAADGTDIGAAADGTDAGTGTGTDTDPVTGTPRPSTGAGTAGEGTPAVPLPPEWAGSDLPAEEPFRSFLAAPGPETAAEMERYGAELAARHTGLDGDALCTLTLAVLDGCGPPEGRAQLRTDLAARAAGAAAQTDTTGPAAGRATVWRTLGDLLAREEGAEVAGQPLMRRLAPVFAGDPGAPAARRFRLLSALYETVTRG